MDRPREESKDSLSECTHFFYIFRTARSRPFSVPVASSEWHFWCRTTSWSPGCSSAFLYLRTTLTLVCRSSKMKISFHAMWSVDTSRTLFHELDASPGSIFDCILLSFVGMCPQFGTRSEFRGTWFFLQHTDVSGVYIHAVFFVDFTNRARPGIVHFSLPFAICFCIFTL